MRNSLCFSGACSVEPTIIPSRTLHSRGSPSQPSRSLPLNMGRKPSSASRANEQTRHRRASLRTGLSPFDLEGTDLDVFLGPILCAAWNFRDLIDNVVSFDDFAEHAVFVIEPGGGGDGNEELAAVGIGASIGHGQHAGLRVLQIGVELIGKLITRATAAGAFGAAALDHEIGNHAMKDEAVVERFAGFLAFGQRHEILDRKSTRLNSS